MPGLIPPDAPPDPFAPAAPLPIAPPDDPVEPLPDVEAAFDPVELTVLALPPLDALLPVPVPGPVPLPEALEVVLAPLPPLPELAELLTSLEPEPEEPPLELC